MIYKGVSREMFPCLLNLVVATFIVTQAQSAFDTLQELGSSDMSTGSPHAHGEAAPHWLCNV